MHLEHLETRTVYLEHHETRTVYVFTTSRDKVDLEFRETKYFYVEGLVISHFQR